MASSCDVISGIGTVMCIDTGLAVSVCDGFVLTLMLQFSADLNAYTVYLCKLVLL